jgi:tetratricopeptide (TPR) repeat protein
MPRNGSIDIPHVAVTDHFIRKRPNKDVNNTSSTPKFLGLQCINNPKPDDITIGRAYLEFFERFNSSSPNLLDSAINFLNKQEKIEQSTYNNKDYIRAYFLKDSYEKTTQLAANLTPEKTIDPWTAYRIGEAYFKQGNIQTAKAWYQRAVDIWPYALDFQNKYGTCLLALQETQTAQKVFEYVLKENPKNQLANSQLGWIYMHNGNTTLAYDYLMRAHQLDPDHAQTVINLAVIYYQKGDKKAAQVLLSRLVRRHPENQQAQAMLADLANGS